MLNQVILVGRISEFNKIDDNKLNLVISTTDPFKNENGEYENYLIDCELMGNIATATNDYCKIGDVVGVKGRIKSYNQDSIRILKIIAEKVTFLSSKKIDE